MRVENAMAISAGLYVLGGSLEPATITHILGVKPVDQWSKGDPIPRVDGPPGFRKGGGWTLTVDADSRDPASTLRQLLALLDDRVAELTGAAGVEDAYFDLFISQPHGSPEAYLEVEAKTLSDLQRSGLPLRLTFCETGLDDPSVG